MYQLCNKQSILETNRPKRFFKFIKYRIKRPIFLNICLFYCNALSVFPICFQMLLICYKKTTIKKVLHLIVLNYTVKNLIVLLHRILKEKI